MNSLKALLCLSFLVIPAAAHAEEIVSIDAAASYSLCQPDDHGNTICEVGGLTIPMTVLVALRDCTPMDQGRQECSGAQEWTDTLAGHKVQSKLQIFEWTFPDSQGNPIRGYRITAGVKADGASWRFANLVPGGSHLSDTLQFDGETLSLDGGATFTPSLQIGPGLFASRRIR